MSWKWECKDGDQWISNGLRFATENEAKQYGFDLGMRWLGMPDPARAAESTDPVNYRLVGNTLEALK